MNRGGNPQPDNHQGGGDHQPDDEWAWAEEPQGGPKPDGEGRGCLNNLPVIVMAVGGVAGMRLGFETVLFLGLPALAALGVAILIAADRGRTFKASLPWMLVIIGGMAGAKLGFGLLPTLGLSALAAVVVAILISDDRLKSFKKSLPLFLLATGTVGGKLLSFDWIISFGASSLTALLLMFLTSDEEEAPFKKVLLFGPGAILMVYGGFAFISPSIAKYIIPDDWEWPLADQNRAGQSLERIETTTSGMI